MTERRFRVERFGPRVISATDRLFRSRPWTGTEAERYLKFRRWLIRASSAYGVSVPGLLIAPGECGAFGTYDEEDGYIFLPRYSALSTFRTFCLHRQFVVDQRMNMPAAAEWSRALFFQVRPHLYEKAVEEGKIPNP